MAHRVGFGLGLFSTPGYAITGGGLLGTALFGAQMGIRWWVTERLAVLPSLVLSVAHTSVPDTKSPFGDVVKGYETTSGAIAPSILASYAVYAGRTTRFMLSAGPTFIYTVQPDATAIYPDGSQKPPTNDIKRITFAIAAGFALEQFLTPRISVVVGADAPVFAYTSSQKTDEDPTTTVSADFNSTKLSASVFFYLD